MSKTTKIIIGIMSLVIVLLIVYLNIKVSENDKLYTEATKIYQENSKLKSEAERLTERAARLAADAIEAQGAAENYAMEAQKLAQKLQICKASK